MKIEITSRNYEVSERLKEIADKKLAKLDKYFDGNNAKAKVCFKKEAQSLTVEVMLDYAGKLVRATASGDNFYDDLDVVLPKLEGQIRKHRTRFDKHQKNVAFRDAAVSVVDSQQQLANTLDKLNRTLDSIRALSDSLEDDPSSLLRGKQRKPIHFKE
jgi:putative sigma-54 modulation protein